MLKVGKTVRLRLKDVNSTDKLFIGILNGFYRYPYDPMIKENNYREIFPIENIKDAYETHEHPKFGNKRKKMFRVSSDKSLAFVYECLTYSVIDNDDKVTYKTSFLKDTFSISKKHDGYDVSFVTTDYNSKYPETDQ